MFKAKSFIILLLFSFACQSPEKRELDQEILTSLGAKHKTVFAQAADNFEALAREDSSNVEVLLGLAEMKIILYVFGYLPRKETLPTARAAVETARNLDSLNAGVLTFSGVLSLLDWDWYDSKDYFQRAIKTDPQDPKPRHWYSLYLSAMGRFDEAMAQSDTIMMNDPSGDYDIGRGSLFYFARRNQELRELMVKTVAADTTVPWGYDWLGMAYIELNDYDNSIETYFKAFELSDGTVEVGAGLSHALGLAGEYELAKQMADYYALAAKDQYLPPVQRAFVHIGIGEYDEAIKLLEQAYEERSWFIIFMQVEPWLDPLRDDERFNEIMGRMEFPS